MNTEITGLDAIALAEYMASARTQSGAHAPCPLEARTAAGSHAVSIEDARVIASVAPEAIVMRMCLPEDLPARRDA